MAKKKKKAPTQRMYDKRVRDRNHWENLYRLKAREARELSVENIEYEAKLQEARLALRTVISGLK